MYRVTDVLIICRVLDEIGLLHPLRFDRRSVFGLDPRIDGLMLTAGCSRLPKLTSWEPAGLDSTNLKVLSSSGTPQQQHDARAVLSLLSRGRHWVLVSLLLGNVLVNETLPVFLDAITGGGGIWAVLISAGAILVCGEVIPQAVCSRHGLRIGAKCVGFVTALVSYTSLLKRSTDSFGAGRCTSRDRLPILSPSCSIIFSENRTALCIARLNSRLWLACTLVNCGSAQLESVGALISLALQTLVAIRFPRMKSQ